MIDAHGTDITDTELAAMPYTTAIVKETLRQKAIVSSVWRKTLVDIELGGYRIPKVSPLAPLPPPLSPFIPAEAKGKLRSTIASLESRLTA